MTERYGGCRMLRFRRRRAVYLFIPPQHSDIERDGNEDVDI